MFSRSSRPITTLFGIPLHVHWTALFTGAFIAISAPAVVGIDAAGVGAQVLVGALAALLFGVTLLVHEYAHALMARRQRIGVRRVSLWALGGVAELEREPQSWRQEFAVTIVGPLASIAVGAVSLGAGVGLGVLGVDVPARLLLWLGVINLVLGVFNLLPGYPLDGGRVLHSLIWWRSGDRNRATIATAGAGRVIGTLLVAFGVWSFLSGGSGLLTALVGWFVMSSAAQARVRARQAASFSGIRAGAVARPVPPAVHGDLSVGDLLRYWVPANGDDHELVLVTDADDRATAVLPMSAAWQVPPWGRDSMPVSSIAIEASATAVVSPATDLADAVAQSPSGIVLVAEPDRLVGVISPSDLSRGATEHHRTPAGVAS